MDLESRGRPDLAAMVRSSWMEAADDHEAAVVMPVYEVYRAVVRAAVAALRADGAAARSETDRYLELAERLTRPRRPVLYATCGVSGSGKTTLAADLVAAAEAVRLRSDVERKRLAGMRPTDRPVDEAAVAALYDPLMTRRLYRRLAELARTLLEAGTSVVVDAACLKRWQRGEFGAVAREAAAPLVWLVCDLPEEVVLGRVAARLAAGGDASDASPEVVRGQLESREPITADELAAAGPFARLVRVTEADLDDSTFAPRVAQTAGKRRP
jgi:predicted kinase